MPRNKLDQIKYRLRGITHGSWRRRDGNDFREVIDNRGLLIAEVRNGHDGNFVANAPDDLRWCVEEIERLRDVITELKEDKSNEV